jgi:CBS domain-containing protein
LQKDLAGGKTMKVKEIMTSSPACCTAETSLREVAAMFVDHDCGAVPVVDGRDTSRPIGIVTDRDIACRAVAKGLNALELTARDCMSSPSVTVMQDAGLDEAIRLMEENKVRRLPVVDAQGRCVGIVAQADIALSAGKGDTADVVRQISEPARRSALRE